MSVEQSVLMRIGSGIQSTRRKSAPVPLRPPQIPHDLGSNPGRRGGKPATNRLSYGTAIRLSLNFDWNTTSLPNVFRDSPQPLHARSGIVPRSGHDHFLTNPSPFVCHPNIWCCIVLILKSSLNKHHKLPGIRKEIIIWRQYIIGWYLIRNISEVIIFLCICTPSATGRRVRHCQLVTCIVTSSLESCYILFSTYFRNSNLHGDFCLVR
jgi:hypothetical protein